MEGCIHCCTLRWFAMRCSHCGTDYSYRNEKPASDRPDLGRLITNLRNPAPSRVDALEGGQG